MTEGREEYKDAKFERQPAGTILLGNECVAHTLMCPHCGGHFVSRAGSGAKRSYCHHCNAVTCGKKACVSRCYPLEKWMEDVEKKATRDIRLKVI